MGSSLWTNIRMPACPILSENIECDVCVIGAGIAGITTAYLLTQRGLEVCVLDSYGIGAGQTSFTTAHLTAVLDTRYYQLEKVHGIEGARIAAQAHTAAIEKIEAIVRRENIDCDFARVNGYLYAEPEHPASILSKESKAARRAGLYQAHLISQAPFNFFPTKLCLVLPNQAQFHPLKYLQGIANSSINYGVKFYCNTPVTEVNGGLFPNLKTSTGYTVKARSIVVATNAPIQDKLTIHAKMEAYRTYAMAAKIPRGAVPQSLFWDIEDPYHYFRVQRASDSEDFLIVGGEDHRTGQNPFPNDASTNLETWARKHFPFLREITHRWSGQVMQSDDGLAYLGYANENNIYEITGDSGNGITNTTIGAMIITNLIEGEANPWSQVFDPSRIKVRALGSYIRANSKTAAQYSDWVTPKPLSAVLALEKGEGVVVSQDFRKLAVYRNASGAYEYYSAVCPHLGGIVRWNNFEKTWDCPCHGSRFDSSGNVIEGPAVNNLKHADYDVKYRPEPTDTLADRIQPKEALS